MIHKVRPHPVSCPNLEGINEELQSGRVEGRRDRVVRTSGLCTSVPPPTTRGEGGYSKNWVDEVVPST